jgi:hypothetical protein
MSKKQGTRSEEEEKEEKEEEEEEEEEEEGQHPIYPSNRSIIMICKLERSNKNKSSHLSSYIQDFSYFS